MGVLGQAPLPHGSSHPQFWDRPPNRTQQPPLVLGQAPQPHTHLVVGQAHNHPRQQPLWGPPGFWDRSHDRFPTKVYLQWGSTTVYMIGPIRHTHCREYISGIFVTYNMKGHNKCAWLKRGEAKECGKSCLGEYCKIHLAKIRKHGKIPVPCRSCGKGVLSEIPLCRACGREKVRHKHNALERRCKKQFDLVLCQLREKVRHIALEKRYKEQFDLVLCQLLAVKTPI